MKKRPPVQVTEHALVQYLAQAWSVDVEALRTRIARMAQTAHDHDAQCVNRNGIRFVVKDGKVITVLGKGQLIRRQR